MITMMIMAILIFPWTKHPLSMGFMLILQTLFISISTGLMMTNFWFSYILLITMLSGMLVLFIYMSSIASNEKFNLSIKMSLIFIISPLSLYLDYTIKNSKFFPAKTKILEYEQINSMLKLFNDQGLMTIMMVLYLLFTMICITYIVNIYEGPMRQKS
uniref:NADH dehydrogenase subunit 6 n=1 Tax=Coleoptera sp. 1 KM-2017 TaxID=2219312 RepID=A0A346RG69_9COLE|nr:NADH dehydrogenase subunit 6 [Coleoptera sp. 1 KM-2017]